MLDFRGVASKSHSQQLHVSRNPPLPSNYFSTAAERLFVCETSLRWRISATVSGDFHSSASTFVVVVFSPGAVRGNSWQGKPSRLMLCQAMQQHIMTPNMRSSVTLISEFLPFNPSVNAVLFHMCVSSMFDTTSNWVTMHMG